MLRSGAQIVKTLSVRGSGLEPVASRLHAEALFGGVELRPAGLPASAILCVRRLQQAWPEAIHVGQPSQRQREAFHRALGASLARVAERAARPAHEAVPADAQAVVFADRAELLTALARDLIRQCVAQRWWWASLLVRGLDDRAVFASWVDAVRYAPAAATMLASTRELSSFIARWPAPELASLVHAVALAHALPWLPALLLRLTDLPEPLSSPDRVRAPWASLTVEPELALLCPLAQLFCGVTITLWEVAPRARSAAFVAAVEHWVAALGAPPAQASLAHAQTRCEADGAVWRPRVHAEPTRPSPQLESYPRAERAERAPPDASALPVPVAPLQRDAPRRDTAVALVSSEAAAARPLPPTPPLSSRAACAEADGLTAAIVAAPERASAPPSLVPLPPRAAAARTLGSAVQSELGGLFFLINLALYLELYGDFSTPLSPGLALPVWDFVAIVGAALLGDADLPSDPAWSLLARLAGREHGEAPGHDFAAPEALRMLAAWLRPFEREAACAFQRAGERLLITHPAGFTLVDVAAEDDLHAQAVREAEPYGASLAASPAVAAVSQSALSRWSSWLTGYTKVRLGRALSLPEHQVGSALCRISARVHTTAGHVDIVMRLADLPIEVRLAGLDRDPGWLPGAGRTIAFHFA